jgi:hypothetical protein
MTSSNATKAIHPLHKHIAKNLASLLLICYLLFGAWILPDP